MTTHALAGTAGYGDNTNTGISVLENIIDCSVNNCSSSDVVQALAIPANTLVLRVCVQCVTAEGSTLTVGVGDGNNATGYLSSVNCNSTSTNSISSLALTTGTPNTVTGYTGGEYYTASDTIDLTFNNAASNAVIRVMAIVADLNGKRKTNTAWGGL